MRLDCQLLFFIHFICEICKKMLIFTANIGNYLPGNHKTSPLSNTSCVLGWTILLKIAVLGFGRFDKFVTSFRAFPEFVPDIRITATPHFP